MALTQVSTGGIQNATIKNEDIEADTVQLTKLQNMATNHILGRSTSGTGNPEILSGAQTRTILGIADGANQTTINNNANDRVITGSGTANTLNAESGVQINSDGRMMVNGTYGAAMFNVTGETALGLDAKRQFLGINSDNDDMNIRATYYSGGASGGAYPDIKFTTTDSERLRITAGGNIGIGTGSPAVKLDVTGKIHASTSIGIRTTSPQQNLHVHQTDSGASVLKFTNTTTTIGSTNGFDLGLDSSEQGFLNVKENKPLQFSTNNTERMRIASDGKVGIGTTSPANKLHLYESTSGSNYIHFSNSSTGISTSDGAQVGIDGNERLIVWQSENNDTRFATNNTERMRILAGGGLTFNGDTAAANALDDYEEGTFTATCDNGVTLHSSQDLCMYTKIGRQVTVRGQIRVNDENGGNQSLIINNAPFTNVSGNDGSASCVGALRLWDQNVPSDTINAVCEMFGGSNTINFWINRDDTGAERMKANSNAYALFTITYFTS